MKVFLVVGTLFPFDRMVMEVDRWAEGKTDIEVVGQVGYGKYKPKNIKSFPMLKAGDFNRIFEESDLVITHAGMGIILKSLVANKPIIVLPRKLELNEHTTDHQMATAIALEKMDYVQIAWETDELLKHLETPEEIQSKRKIEAFASKPLIDSLRNFINSH